MYRTSDDLYSLYVVATNEPNGSRTSDGFHPVLREISVPDSDLYRNRVIDIYDILRRNSDTPESEYSLDIRQAIMSKFVLDNQSTSFFILSNNGFHKLSYENDFTTVSVDSLTGTDYDGNPTGLKDRLEHTLRQTVMADHIAKKHDNVDYFSILARKIN